MKSSSSTRPFSQNRVPTLLKRVILKIDAFVFPRLVVPLISFLPSPVAYGVAILRADFLFFTRLLTERWIEVASGMKLVFGDRLTEKEFEQQVQSYIRSRSCRLVDAMRLYGDGRSLLRLVEFRGLDRLKSEFNRGKGVILCSAHFGSPICSYSVIGALGYPVTLISRWSYPTRGNGIQTRIIKRLVMGLPINSHLKGHNIMRQKKNLGVAFQAAGVLRKGGVLGIMMDSNVMQNDPTRSVVIDFLNKKIRLATGPVALSKITGSPILVMLMYRTSNMKKLILEITPPITIDRDEATSLRRCLSLLEVRIHSSPGQWDQWYLFRDRINSYIP